jgi:putative membrane protein
MKLIPNFLKGFLMGTCDLIPGISGGTIAFITGIYEKLINEINNILKFKKFDFLFIFTLAFGILGAIFSLSHAISYLLETYPYYLLSFFLGLIIASSKYIYDKIPHKNNLNVFIGGIGFILGLIFVFFSPASISNPSVYYILFGGFLAITAMFLPGISGSFILLLLGLYKFVLDSVKNLDYQIIFIFGIGVLIGIIVISKLIKFLLEKDKSKTLFFLLGLVLGSSIVIGNKIYISKPSFSLIEILLVVIFFLLGVLGSLLINKLEKNNN